MRRADLVLVAIPGLVLSGLLLERAMSLLARTGANQNLVTLSKTVPFSFVGLILAGFLIGNEIVRAPAVDS